MTSRWRSKNSAGDVAACDKQSSAVTDSPQPGGTFYDDSLRPKSFLHDEMDEFNRVLAELLESRQRPEPTAEEDDDFLCRSSWFQDYKEDAFQTTEPDRLWTNCGVVYDDFESLNTTDVQHDPVWDSEPSDAQRTAAQCDDDDDDDDNDDREVTDDDSGDDVLGIVEEDDCHLVAKDSNIHSLQNVCTEDLFNEVRPT